MTPTTKHPGRILRDLMDKQTVAMPGAFNGLVARAATQVGFEALYISGAAVSAASGVPDVGLVSVDGFTHVIREVANSSGLPVLADADTGFGEAEMVTRTVWDYHLAGAAGLHIEDQQFPKRCGHLDGKNLVSIDHMSEKISYAANARDAASGGDFVICARTDARGVEGFDAALDRAQAYLKAGADMIFPEGLTSEEEFGRFAEQIKGRMGRNVYLLANMTEFGKTPMVGLKRFSELGYSAVIYPVTTLRIAMGAVTSALETLKREGSTEPLLPQMQTRKDLYNLLGYTPGEPWTYPNPNKTRND
jgi:methylisocitrate lyase